MVALPELHGRPGGRGSGAGTGWNVLLAMFHGSFSVRTIVLSAIVPKKTSGLFSPAGMPDDAGSGWVHDGRIPCTST